MVGTSAWRSEVIDTLRPGDTVPLAGYEVVFEGVEPVAGPNYTADRGRFTVRRGDRVVATLFPEKRFYPVAQMGTTEAAIHTTLASDVYVALGNGPAADGTWTVRLYHHPLVPWIWFGAIVMAVGGLVSLSDRRLRVGAPKRARRPAAAAEPQPAE